MKVLLFSLVLGLLVASQGEAQTDASQVLGHLNGGPSLGGGLDVYLCEHPFEVWLCGSLSLANSLQFKIAPFTGSSPAI